MTFREQICKWLTRGKHSPIQGDDGKCLICGFMVKPPVVVPPTVPDVPDSPAEEGGSTSAGDPPDDRQPQRSPPRWTPDGAAESKVNRWNEKTSGGMAKILLPAKYLNRTCWATLLDSAGVQEVMRHKSPSDNGGRPRYYAEKPGSAYRGPVFILVQTLDGDLKYTIQEPAAGIG